jgi:hypothetical protein
MRGLYTAVMRVAGPMGLTFAVVVALGCGTSKPGSCDLGCWQPTPADEAFIESLCDLTDACCVKYGVLSAQNVADCKTRLQQNGLSADETLRSACLAELQQLQTSATCLPWFSSFDDPCVRLWNEPAGRHGPGATCWVNSDCAGAAGAQTACLHFSENAALHCMVITPGHQGDTCVRGGQDPAFVQCDEAEGLHCVYHDPAGASGICDTLSPAGEACRDGSTCASGSCLNANLQEVVSGVESGTCASIVSAGQVCLAPGVNAACDDTSSCVAGTDSSVCTPRLAAGSACSDVIACLSGNCLGETCSPWTVEQQFDVVRYCGDL